MVALETKINATVIENNKIKADMLRTIEHGEVRMSEGSGLISYYFSYEGAELRVCSLGDHTLETDMLYFNSWCLCDRFSPEITEEIVKVAEAKLKHNNHTPS